MAYVELAPLTNGSKARNTSVSGISTASTGVAGDVFMISAYSDMITVSAVATTASSSDIEVCCCRPEIVQAGGGIWVAITGLTAVAATAKMATFSGPITAVRINVKSALAGSISISIRSDNESS